MASRLRVWHDSCLALRRAAFLVRKPCAGETRALQLQARVARQHCPLAGNGVAAASKAQCLQQATLATTAAQGGGTFAHCAFVLRVAAGRRRTHDTRGKLVRRFEMRLVSCALTQQARRGITA